MSLKKSLETTVNPIIESAKSKRIIHLQTDDTMLVQNLLATDRGLLNNFGSCSYLGMEFDERLVEGSVDAIRRFGTQFSASRAYMSISLYSELERLMEQITDAPVLITPTTTLGHLSIIPTIISSEDAVIMDHQVHNSVQMALKPVKLGKSKVEVLRHNRMDLLRERIVELSQTHEKIWYMADGIYSMFGDACPLEELYDLLEEFPKFHLYVDDAHGMSCYGDKGQGYVLSKKTIHAKMIVALSMAKAFASGGAVFAFGNNEWRDLSRNCGGPMITSGPIQPAVLGASVAMAKIQLSEEFSCLKNQLQHKIQFMNDLLELNNLPLIAVNDSPIFFVGTSKPEIAKNIIDRMIKLGYFLNLGIYPAVPIKNTGIRFTVTRLHSKEAMKEMVKRLAKVYFEEIEKAGMTLELVWSAFKLKPKYIEERQVRQLQTTKCEVFDSITEIDKGMWDLAMATNPLMAWDQLVSSELSSGDYRKPGNWKQKYLIVKNPDGEWAAATVVSIARTKDDMLASSEVSQQAELSRLTNPDHLTSISLMTGIPYSSGDHMYVNKALDWKKAVNLMIAELDVVKAELGASSIFIREYSSEQAELMEHIAEQGFFKVEMLPAYHLENMDWDSLDDLIETLSTRSRRHVRKDVKANLAKFEVEVSNYMQTAELSTSYALFRSVHGHGKRINTFALPETLFYQMNQSPQWKTLNLYLTENGQRKLVGTAWGYMHNGVMDFPVVGIDYEAQKKHRCYQQILFQSYKLGKESGAVRINWGYTSDTEKRKFKAIPTMKYCMVQTDDNYTQSLLMEMSEQRPIAV